MAEPIDFDNLPENPFQAFVILVGLFDEQLAEDIRGNEEGDTRLALISHMNKITGAARALHIEALRDWELPDYDNTYNVHREFDLATKSIVLQIQIQKARIGAIYSVELDAATKARIHNLVNEIRQLVEAADLEVGKKNSLFSNLNAFDADVDRARTRFDNGMLMGISIADLINKGANALKPANELLKRINELLGGAKTKEAAPEKLPSPDDIKRVEKPRKQIQDFRRASRELDDEIPF
ncbi:hypothetical protein NKH34_29465 [Mesorhizobium sp. M1148]|uniref:hypothetical protein n=1 Tax=unclassified Mesorhizobium TaxID=325217 RepID=UPI0003CF546E|nr:MULTISPECIES: hypothetical protein [unclassified Mesorhizobium]ESX09734.1 hypothetical protein X768_17110 [Mesorhizobium sp. LSJC265A00]ESZ56275.1 hypothetical protein X728_25655 [Mesorhizobium sp. L103C120A0]ESZ58267.1 hypothetical protein X727_32050 [Mesorhizobium sp. L103C119B0]WJI44710.1 hypothetical protein NL532_29730 [Mesorhizobium sp. C120A]